MPFLALILVYSCVPTPIECIRVSSNSTTESRSIKDFSGVVLFVPATLKISQGADYAVKLTGPQNVVELTKTTLLNDELTISTEDCFNGSYELLIEVTAPDFDLIYAGTAASLETNGAILGDNIRIELVGEISGSATFGMDSIFTSVSGKGNLNFSGSTKYHQLYLTGEADIAGFALSTDHTVIDLAGLAECEVTANERLEVTIAGSGNVYYKGNPQIDSNITGTGEIINSN
jgi:hypothetical protein